MKTDAPIQAQDPNSRGEQIIFDIVIKDKLTHIIVIKDDKSYHLNLDGEDFGSFIRNGEDAVTRFKQPKGANRDDENYFKPILAKLNQLGK